MAQVAPGEWNSARAQALVALAIGRRTQQIGDTGLVGYKAMGHGYVTFLAEVGEGVLEAAKVIKVDELMSEIYWHAPNQSKQRIIGLRDTLLLPADIQYYRDRFGIFQNNLPDLIRTGDGQDIRDVPHPLSRGAAALYDYAVVVDSLVIHTPGNDIHVIQVAVRPKDDQKPRVIREPLHRSQWRPGGAHGVPASRTQPFSMLGWRKSTSCSENRLVADRYWLPSSQRIEVRRSGTWLDFPVKRESFASTGTWGTTH